MTYIHKLWLSIICFFVGAPLGILYGILTMVMTPYRLFQRVMVEYEAREAFRKMSLEQEGNGDIWERHIERMESKQKNNDD